MSTGIPFLPLIQKWSPTAAMPPVGSNAPGTANAMNRTGNSTGNQSNGNQGSGIEKQQNGMYILHANVDEVLLNCAVMDSNGQPVTGFEPGGLSRLGRWSSADRECGATSRCARIHGHPD